MYPILLKQNPNKKYTLYNTYKVRNDISFQASINLRNVNWKNQLSKYGCYTLATLIGKLSLAERLSMGLGIHIFLDIIDHFVNKNKTEKLIKYLLRSPLKCVNRTDIPKVVQLFLKNKSSIFSQMLSESTSQKIYFRQIQKRKGQKKLVRLKDYRKIRLTRDMNSAILEYIQRKKQIM